MQKYCRLIHYARPHWRFFVLIFILTIAASVLAALQPLPLAFLTDHVLGQVPLSSRVRGFFDALSLPPTPEYLLGVTVLGGLVLFALNSVFEIGLTWAWTLGGRRMVYSLAEDLFARLQRRSLLFHRRNSVGDTMGRVATDSWAVYQVMDTLVFAPGHALLTTVVMAYLMAQSDLRLMLLALVIAPFMVGASFLVGKPLRAAAKLKREIESRIQSHIQQTLTGIPVVTTLMARGSFPDSHKQHLGMPGMHGTVAAVAALQRSDLIISLGARFDDRVTGNLDSFAPGALIIHADIDPAEIGKNRITDVPIVGDCREVIADLTTLLRTESAAGRAQLGTR